MWSKTGNELLDEIHTAEVNSQSFLMWRIGQCGYVIKFDGKIILIDPVLNDLTDENGTTVRLYPYPFTATEIGADFVICTHGHADHLAEETIKEFASKNGSPVFIVPAGCKKQMEKLCNLENKIVYLSDGEIAELPTCSGSFKVRAISAAHPEHYLEKNDDRMALSYQLQLGNKTLVHLGDTYLTEQLLHNLEQLPAPDVFLPPINGDDLFRKMINFIGNMEAEEAAKLAVRLDAKMAIPTHYDMVKGNTADPQRFINEMTRLGKSKNCLTLELGGVIRI